MAYKLLTYRAGRVPRAGLLIGDTVHDGARVTGQAGYATVLGALADWRRARRLFAQAAKRLAARKTGGKGVALARARLLAPVLYPGNIYCAGANYTDHMAEMARAQGQTPGPN